MLFRPIKQYRANVDRLSATDLNDIVMRLERLERLHVEAPLHMAESRSNQTIRLAQFIPSIRRMVLVTDVVGVVPNRSATAYEVLYRVDIEDYYTDTNSLFTVYDYLGDWDNHAGDVGYYWIMPEGRREIAIMECP